MPSKGFGASLTGQICIALVVTAGIVLALILFAIQTNYDYTGIGFYLNFGIMAIMIFGIIAISPTDPRPIVRGKIFPTFNPPKSYLKKCASISSLLGIGCTDVLDGLGLRDSDAHWRQSPHCR